MRSNRKYRRLQRIVSLATGGVLFLSGLSAQLLAHQRSQSERETSARENRSPVPAESPIIRVALIIDASSIEIGCPAGLRIGEGGERDRLEPFGTQLRVEVRQLDLKSGAPGRSKVFQILVASFDDAGRARKLASSLQDYGEPVSLSYDHDDEKYEVIIGRFVSSREAEPLLATLKKNGFRSARINETEASKDKKAASQRDSDAARRAKQAAQPESGSSNGMQLVALESGRIVASSDETLLITPAGEDDEKQLNRSKREPRRNEDSRTATAGRPYDFARNGDDRNQPATDTRRATTTSAARSGEPALIRVGGKPYRGDIHLVMNKRGRMNVVNAVPVEDYLRGVVPLELSPIGYPEIEALKAQAVAARTYALAHRGDRESEGYDVRDDARSQVYGGVADEHPLSDRAVEETREIVATAPDSEGHWVPIDALYSANCGGHTENNENVFGGKARSYLRGVACEADLAQVNGREIASKRNTAGFVTSDGRSIAREVSLLQVLGFSLTRINSRYLGAPVDEAELKSWGERAAVLSGQPRLSVEVDTDLSSFVTLAASAVYGEGRASVLVTPADASYILSGLTIGESVRAGGGSSNRTRNAAQARSSLALLIKTGALRLPAEGSLNLNAPVTRGQAIEVLGRALVDRLRGTTLVGSVSKNQISQISNSKSGEMSLGTAAGVDRGRLVLTTQASGRDGATVASNPPRYVTVEASTRTSRARQEDGSASLPGANESSRESGVSSSPGLEVEADAWLFRNLAGESYQVNRLALIGGEQVLYHVGSGGRIDFMEVTPSDRSAATDRFSKVASWQERLSADEVGARLARARAGVGQPQSIKPLKLNDSGRVAEMEIVGTDGTSKLRGGQIKNVLGLRETLFVVDAEADSKGRVIAFVFTGRGWGHGVGLCQTGAYGLARQGYSYKAILQKYYTGIRVQKGY